MKINEQGVFSLFMQIACDVIYECTLNNRFYKKRNILTEFINI